MNGLSLLKCICDETRFEILESLQKDKELCVNDFVEKLNKDQPLVSHHLKTLKKCGIVKSRDEGSNVFNIKQTIIRTNIKCHKNK